MALIYKVILKGSVLKVVFPLLKALNRSHKRHVLKPGIKLLMNPFKSAIHTEYSYTVENLIE